MNEVWLKPLALILIFSAVVFVVERIVSEMVGRKLQTQAINQRLDLISRGVSRGQAMQLLRRKASIFPERLPEFFAAPAIRFEKMLMAAGVSVPTGRLFAILIATPVVIFVTIVLVLMATGGGFGFGRIVMVATVSFLLGAGLPIMFFKIRADRMRKKIEDQFPVALDVFVRGLRAAGP